MRSIVYRSILDTEIGTLLITGNRRDLLGIKFIEEDVPLEENENEVTKYVKKELEEYFAGTRTSFSFYYFNIAGFQKRVLEVVEKIPYGKVMTYRQIASLAGNEMMVREVAKTILNNPYPIIIPCHRVIGGDRKLHGYQAGVEKQRQLLMLEKKVVKEIKENEECTNRRQ